MKLDWCIKRCDIELYGICKLYVYLVEIMYVFLYFFKGYCGILYVFDKLCNMCCIIYFFLNC